MEPGRGLSDAGWKTKMGTAVWKSEDGTDIAVSMNGYRPDKIYKDMSLIDNITYLANDKVSNALGIINKKAAAPYGALFFGINPFRISDGTI